MPGKRADKKRGDSELPGSAGLSQTASGIDHAFAASDTGKKSHRFVHMLSPKQWLMLIVALLMAITGGYLIWRSNTPEENKKTVYTSEGVELRKLSNEQLQDELEKLIFEKKFSSAEELINYQDDASSPELRMLLVATYINQGKPDDALRVLTDVEKRYPDNWQVPKTIARVYQSKGDNTKALEYYKKSLELLKQDKDVPVREDEIYNLEASISQLEGQQ